MGLRSTALLMSEWQGDAARAARCWNVAVEAVEQPAVSKGASNRAGKGGGRAMPPETYAAPEGQIVRVIRRGEALHILVDGHWTAAQTGDSVLAAVLLAGHVLRRSEFSGEPRAGFCLMGACQDCWMWTADGHRIRACTTRVSEGLAVLTQPPDDWPGAQADPRV
jgi:D-hydroxyproline dehydrogenase subunit gamma